MKFDDIYILLLVIYFVWRFLSWRRKKLLTYRSGNAPGRDDNRRQAKSVPPQVPVSDDMYPASAWEENDDTEIRPMPTQDKISGQTTDAPLPNSSTCSCSIQDLRNAVIWSEILAPPLALRDEE